MSLPMSFLEGAFSWTLRTSWQAAALAGLILLVQWLLRARLSPAWRHGLWLILVARLLLPTAPPSAFSMFNLVNRRAGPPILRLPAGDGSSVSSVAERVQAPALSAPGTPSVPASSPALLHEPSSRMPWFDTALAVWLGGFCFFLARLAWGAIRFSSQITDAPFYS